MTKPAAVLVLLVLVVGLPGHGAALQVSPPAFDLPVVTAPAHEEKTGVPLWKQVLGSIVAAIAGSYWASRKGASKGSEKIERELSPSRPADPGTTFRDEIVGLLNGISEGQRTTDRRLLLSDTERGEQHGEVLDRLDEGNTRVGHLGLRVDDMEKRTTSFETAIVNEAAARAADVARLEEILKVRTSDKRTPRPEQTGDGAATPPGGVPAIPPDVGPTAS